MQAASDSSDKATSLSVISNHDSPVQAERFSVNIQVAAFSSNLDQATQSPHFCLPHGNSRKVRSSKAWRWWVLQFRTLRLLVWVPWVVGVAVPSLGHTFEELASNERETLHLIEFIYVNWPGYLNGFNLASRNIDS